MEDIRAYLFGGDPHKAARRIERETNRDARPLKDRLILLNKHLTFATNSLKDIRSGAKPGSSYDKTRLKEQRAKLEKEITSIEAQIDAMTASSSQARDAAITASACKTAKELSRTMRRINYSMSTSTIKGYGKTIVKAREAMSEKNRAVADIFSPPGTDTDDAHETYAHDSDTPDEEEEREKRPNHDQAHSLSSLDEISSMLKSMRPA